MRWWCENTVKRMSTALLQTYLLEASHDARVRWWCEVSLRRAPDPEVPEHEHKRTGMQCFSSRRPSVHCPFVPNLTVTRHERTPSSPEYNNQTKPNQSVSDAHTGSTQRVAASRHGQKGVSAWRRGLLIHGSLRDKHSHTCTMHTTLPPLTHMAQQRNERQACDMGATPSHALVAGS